MKNRRQFLRNIALSPLALSIAPLSTKAENTKVETDLSMCDKTTLDFYGMGPFYTPNAPMLEDHQLAATDEVGTRMIISGRVYNLECSQYIPNTLIDIWHADDAGAYDNEGFNLRGRVYSNEQGFYMFETILPGKYLNGSQFRPAHIHFRITPPGFDRLITQLYFEGDSDIPADAAASITEGEYDASHRIIPLSENADGKLEGTWDIIINGEGIETSTTDLHLDRGMLYNVNPNPFSTSVLIKYGVFNKAKVSLSVYDMQGRLVAVLEERVLSPDKYEAAWKPDSSLAGGHYFVVLKINELQVHYQRIMRTY